MSPDICHRGLQRKETLKEGREGEGERERQREREREGERESERWCGRRILEKKSKRERERKQRK